MAKASTVPVVSTEEVKDEVQPSTPATPKVAEGEPEAKFRIKSGVHSKGGVTYESGTDHTTFMEKPSVILRLDPLHERFERV